VSAHVQARGLLSSRPCWLRMHGGACFVFLYLPVAVLIVFSFSDSASSLVWGGFTTDWYARLAENPRLIRAVGNSLTVAAASTAIGVVLGTMAAVGHAALRKRRDVIEGTMLLPLMAPDIVIALALKLWFVKFVQTGPGLVPMALGHSILAVCYVFLVAGTRMKRFDWRLVEAARDLGAGSWQTFRHVLLPHLWPGVAGGALLSVAVSMDEYVISSFLSGPGTATVPVEVAGMIRKTFTPEINALATLLLVLSVLLALAALLLQRMTISAEPGTSATRDRIIPQHSTGH
jgi:spermidine/putrescine transport system permease protein